MIKIVILGNPATKKNNMQICKNKYTGKTYLIQSEAYRKYEKEFLKQMNIFYQRGHKTPLISHAITLKCIYYMETKRKVDLVNLLNATCDCLVKAKVLVDDNYEIIKSVDGSRVEYDKENPRVVIEITKFEK